MYEEGVIFIVRVRLRNRRNYRPTIWQTLYDAEREHALVVATQLADAHVVIEQYERVATCV